MLALLVFVCIVNVASAAVLSLDGDDWKLTNGSFVINNATVPGT